MLLKKTYKKKDEVVTFQNPPKNRKSWQYKAIVDQGCGGTHYDTPDGTDYDCLYHEWTCDDCPCCLEARRERNLKKLEEWWGA